VVRSHKDVEQTLAGVLVAPVDVDARELHRLLVPTERAQEPHDRGDLDHERRRLDVAIVLLDHLDLPEEEQRERTLPRDDLDGLEALREDERIPREAPDRFSYSAESYESGTFPSYVLGCGSHLLPTAGPWPAKFDRTGKRVS